MVEKIVEVVIPSHKRAAKCWAAFVISNALICIPESQKEQYAEYHDPESLVTHPDSLIGLAPKRQWIYQKFGDVFQLDDDCIGCFRIYRALKARRRAVCSPDRAYDIVQRTADMTRQLGAYMFGFGSHANPASYSPQRPFRFGGYFPGGAHGLLRGSMIKYPTFAPPEMMMGGDHWLVLLNAYYHRYCFIDGRFTFALSDTYVGTGGTREHRVDHAEKHATEFLQEYFGNEVIVEVPGVPTALTKRQRNESKRLIKMPYNV